MDAQTQVDSNQAPVMEESTPIPLSHLEHDLQLIQRYTFLHSSAPFTSNLPIIGPLVAAVKNAGRWALRGLLRATVGAQDEFNAAVAEILFEFTRRAASSAPLTLNDARLDEALRRLATGGPATIEVLTLLAREIQVLQAQVRAAQLAASDNERAIAELRRELDAIKRATDT
ncbi:MAG: hypothetical protein WCF84_26860 [Anaerolineae bacterium]